MESLNQTQTRPIRRRRRPALSCRECRRRKIKCDHNKPCAQCIRHNTQCFYKPFASEESVGTVRPDQQSRDGLRGDHDQSLTPSSSRRSSGSTPTAASPPVLPPSGPAVSAPPDRGLDQVPTFRGILRRIQKLEASSTSGSGNGDGPGAVLDPASLTSAPPPPPPPIAEREWQPVLDKPRDWGRTRWVGGAPEFNTIITCYRVILEKDCKNASFHTPEAAGLISQAGDSLRRSKANAKRIKVDRPTRGLLSPPGFVFALPSRETADEMVRLYFAAFESTHRILHVPTFWAEYQRSWDHPESVTADLRLKILLVIGIGSSLYNHGDAAGTQRNTDLVQQWIYAAQTWFSGPLEKDRLDITGLQIHCLTMLARQIFSIGGDTVWVSMGSLVHGAMQIGMHRDPKHLPAMPLLQAELRRRLWATILELAVQSSLDSWMPLRISLDEFDTEPPSNINDEEIDESTTVLQPHPKDTFTSTSMQLAMLDSLPTRLRVVRLLNDLHSKRTYDRVLALTSELTSALQACATLLRPTPGNDNNNDRRPTPFHRNLLDYLIRRFLIPLHFPFSHQARTNPLFHYSLKVSIDAALALVSPEPGDGGMFARLMAIGGGLFREGIRCATAAISLELLAHVESQRHDGSLHRTSQCRDFLKQAVRDLVTLSEERIRQGETNLKSPMFLNMVLAQVEAIEQGKSVEVAVARAARDSLVLSERVLSLRIGEAVAGNNSMGGQVQAASECEFSGGESGGFWEGMEGLGFDGFFGEEFAWESIFGDGRFG